MKRLIDQGFWLPSMKLCIPSLTPSKHSPYIQHLILFLYLFFNDIPLAIILEAVRGDLVQSQHWLVRILDQDVFAFLALKTHIGDCADDTPSVRKREVHLLGEVARFPTDDAEDYVAVVGLRVGARDESKAILE